MKATHLKPVLATTRFGAIFFGYMQTIPKESTIFLKYARNCVYLYGDTQHFMSMSSLGPNASCRLSDTFPSVTLYGVESIIEITEEAQERWENWPSYKKGSKQ